MLTHNSIEEALKGNAVKIRNSTRCCDARLHSYLCSHGYRLLIPLYVVMHMGRLPGPGRVRRPARPE